MRETICPALCRYYKADKPEEEGCGGILWLQGRSELQSELERLDLGEKSPLYGQDPSHESLLAICDACPYLIDGCDFRDTEVSDEDCSPCGGLRAVAGLMALGCELDI